MPSPDAGQLSRQTLVSCNVHCGSRIESCACDRRRIAIQHRRRAEELHRLGGHGAEGGRNSDRAGVGGPNDASDVRSPQCVAGKLQRCGRPFASVTLAPRVGREHICDLESGESLRFLASDAAKEAAGGAFLNGPSPKPRNVQCPRIIAICRQASVRDRGRPSPRKRVTRGSAMIGA